MPLYAATFLLALLPLQAPMVFRSDGGSVSLDAQARCVSLDSISGENFHDGAKVPVASAWFDGAWREATTLTRAGEHLLLTFGGLPFKLLLDITPHPEGVEFRIADIQGPAPEQVRFAQFSTRGMARRGTVLNCRWNPRVAVALLGLSERVEAAPYGGHGLAANAHRQFGIKGEGALLLIATPATMRQAVRRAERAFGLPSPEIGGQWAKESDAANDSYLFTDLTEANVDETIRLAKLGGFKAILVYGSTWSGSSGSYPINRRSYPGGEESLRRVTDRCRAAGIRVGMHLVTSMISKHDALAAPVPDPRLLVDARGTLASSVGPGDTTLVLQGALSEFPREGAFYGNVKGGRDVRIGSEIVRYATVDEAGRRLLGCQRGVGGTRATSHAQGASVEHLAERYGSYLADLKTNLLGQMADRIAGLIDRCGFDMVYFDGGENASANGPYWYWVGRVQSEVLTRVRRPLVVQGSGITHWNWHWFTRGTCDDYAALAPEVYLDRHKIADSFRGFEDDFLPAELGWWGLLAAAPEWPATLPRDADSLGARMIGLDAPVSLETTFKDLKANGRTEEILKQLSRWESLRKSGGLAAAERNRLRTGEWSLDGQGQPLSIQSPSFLASAGEETVLPVGGIESIRIEALALLASPTHRTAQRPRLLLAAAGQRSEAGVVVPRPQPGQPMPGWPAKRLPLASGAVAPTPFLIGPSAKLSTGGEDLSGSRTLAITLDIRAPTGAELGVLNVQLESPGKMYRDYYVDLRRGLTTTVVDFLDSAPRLLESFRPAYANYSYKAALYTFDFKHVTAVTVRWMKAPAQGVDVRLLAIEPLAETPALLSKPVLVSGGRRIVVPATLRTGEAVEIDRAGHGRVFDATGRERERFTLPAPPRFDSPRVRLEAEAGSRARLTLAVRPSLSGG